MLRTLVVAGLGMVFALGTTAVKAAPAAGPTTRPAGATQARATTHPAVKPMVAVFRLNMPVVETPQDETLALFGEPVVALKDLVARMKKAADDPAVKAVVVFSEGTSMGIGQVEELRQAIKAVRDAGKEVLVHSDSMGMRDYCLLCGANRLSVVPTSDLWVTGLYAEEPYIRGLLDKIGVTPDFMTCGAYKSAAEILMRDGPSPQADEMTNWLMDSLYATSVRLIADGRGVSQEKAKAWIDDGPYTASRAKSAGLVDAVEQRQEFQAYLKDKYGADITFEKKYGQPVQPKLDLSSPFGVFKFWGELLGGGSQARPSGKPAVGIVYVDGPIVLRGEDSIFGSSMAAASELRKALDKAASDDSIKAVVLRVDSPGGSATASEIILDATRRVKAKKPLVVSMGDVAGSGGYYVACAADTIFADESTITGSIGVVGGKLATNPMWKKIGITFKAYQRGRYADILSSAAPFTPDQKQRIQGWMDEIYGVFKSHVSEIRGSKLKKPLDDIAGGRVYTGRQALDLGLVDRIGTLSDAIAFAAEQAKLGDAKTYDVRPVPAPKNIFELLMEQGGDDDDAGRVTLSVGAAPMRLLELAAPYLKGLDPHRAAAIRLALLRVQLLQQEGVAVMMPEVIVGN